jgi:hypothetical protein
MTLRARLSRLERLAGPARRRLFMLCFDVPGEEHPLVCEDGEVWPCPDPSVLRELGSVMMVCRTLDPRLL